jgi:exodeoxyribonuclease V gamma subunit
VLHIHRSERADGLVDALADLLRDTPGDPLAREVIAVPAKGVERWLMQRLSHTLGATTGRQDGVCANVEFPHPARLTAASLATASGVDAAADPWRSEALEWRLLSVIDTCVDEPWCATLARHLGASTAAGAGPGDHRRQRRLATARHLTRLFSSYSEHRPEMLRSWVTGDDGDGAGARVPDDLSWQAELWRRLRAALAVPGPAERLPQACARIRADADAVDLPERVSVFGPTRLTTTTLATLAALAERREIHLWLPHPSPTLWDRIASSALPGTVRRRSDPTLDTTRTPLLSSLGRDSRELQQQLLTTTTGRNVTDTHHATRTPGTPRTLLHALQRSIRDDELPAEQHAVSAPDRSLQVHACHGPARQVEVLRDVLVGLLADDPTLEPRDILVMCPTIESYASLISATFGLDDVDSAVAGTGADPDHDTHPGHRLRVKLADRSLRQTNALLATLGTLLDLAQGRVTASDILDLAASGPVRRRFRFDDDALEILGEWVSSAGIRWGLDAAHRGGFELEQIQQNTWRAGLDRILLGTAMAEDDLRWVGLALPLDDVDSIDVGLAGRFAELLARLGDVLDRMAGDRPLEAWLTTLHHALDSLTAVSDADAWQAAQAHRELTDIAAAAGATTTQLSLADVHALFADRVAGRPTRANFRTGTLTMCSMVPMRSVPHRVVCLLGLDDGEFPRTAAVDGDDVLGRDPCVGERDPRSEDRQLLLDAVLAAREHLVLLYTGADPRTNATRPPAVPVGEILDALDAVAVTADDNGVRQHVVTRHPLQPFDARNFTAGALGVTGPFSFDRHALHAAERAADPRAPKPGLVPRPLAPAAVMDVGLDDLISFVQHPVKAFLRQRLTVTVARDSDVIDDQIAVELSALEAWAVGDRLLKARLSGQPIEAVQQAEWRRGTLPPQQLGRRQLGEVLATLDPIVTAAGGLFDPDGRAVDVTIDLDGRRLTGTIGSLHDCAVVRVEYSRLGARHRLGAWLQLLALTATQPDTAWTAVTIGRGEGRAPVGRSTLGPVDADDACRLLAEVVDLRDRGLRQPLPMAAKSSAAYAQKRAGGQSLDNALRSAEFAWTGGRFDGERDDEAHQLVWGAKPGIDVLTAGAPAADERGPGWPRDEPTRFGVLARRLWAPLLDHEQLGGS